MSNKDVFPKKPYIYLAGPFTHKNPIQQRERGIQHCKLSARLLQEGHLVYSPIAETMNLEDHGCMLGTTWDTWREKDLRQLSIHDQMWILMIEGWESSKGVRGEVKFCLKNNIPVYLYDPVGGHTYGVPIKCLLANFKVKDVEELND